MSQSNIDFLFQVTGADRAFTLSRGDGHRPPFGDHLSVASVNTAFESTNRARSDDDALAAADRSSASRASDRNGYQPDSPNSETSAASASESDPYEDDRSDESASPAGLSASNATGNGSVDAKDTSETDKADDESSVAGETAAGQAAASNQSQSLGSDESVAEAEAELDSVAVDEAVRAKANQEMNGNATGQTDTSERAENGDASASGSGTPDPAGQSLGSATEFAGETDGTKKSRTRSNSKNAAEGESDGNQRISGNGPEGSRVGEVVASLESAAQAEQELKQQLANDEQRPAADDSKNAQNDRASSRQRADVAAVANKIVAAAIQGATQANRDGMTSESGDSAKRVAKQAAKTYPLTTVADQLHPQNTAGKRGTRTSETDAMPNVDPARFVGRVAKAFQTAHERGGTLQLRLAPPELGALRLELTVKDGVMSASLETENQAAKRVLLEHLPALRERLAEQNIRVERFDVDVRREGNGQEPAPQNQERQQQNHSDSRRQSTSQTQTDDAAGQERPVVHPMSNTSGINLVA